MKKAIFYKALLLLLIISFGSCKTQDQKYKAFYKKIQLKKAPKEPEKKPTFDCCELPNIITGNISDINKSLDEWEKVVFAPRKYPDEDDDYVTFPSDTTSNKPSKKKIEEPLLASRVTVISRDEVPVTPAPEVKPEVKPEPKVEVIPVPPTPSEKIAEPAPRVVPPVAEPKSERETIQPISSTPDVLRAVEIRIISGSGDLKKYSVVIASLSKMEGANRLKALFFTETSEKFWIAQNNKGIFYFVVGSFDSKEDAVAKKNALIKEYTSRYTKSQLLKKYGIPFADAWILEKR